MGSIDSLAWLNLLIIKPLCQDILETRDSNEEVRRIQYHAEWSFIKYDCSVQNTSLTHNAFTMFLTTNYGLQDEFYTRLAALEKSIIDAL